MRTAHLLRSWPATVVGHDLVSDCTRGLSRRHMYDLLRRCPAHGRGAVSPRKKELVPAFNPTAAGVTAIQLPTLAIATVLAVLLVLLIFLFSQRFFVAGLTAGGTKE